MTIIGLDTETYIFDEKTQTYKPNLNARDVSLICIIIDKKKKPLFFIKEKNETSLELSKRFEKWLYKFSEQKKKEGKNVFIYAHNNSFDLAGYGQSFIKDTERLRILQQKPLFAIYNKNVYLLDTMAFVRGEEKKNLEQIGRILGIPKINMPKEIKELKELKAYCYNDTKIVLEFIKKIIETMEKLGHRPKRILTAGSLAMSYFKTFIREEMKYKGTPYSSYLYKRGTIHQTFNHKFIRKAQRGARCECFRTGKIENITMTDINSLYPKVLANMDRFPDLLTEKKVINPEIYYEKEEILEMLGVAEATIIRPKCSIGFLPIRKEGKGIYFPYSEKEEGELRATWTIQELKKAQEEGYIIKEIHEMVIYKDLPFNPFKEFIERLYKLRQDSEGIFKQIIKLLMNSLTLKFSQFKGETKRIICERADVLKYEKEGYEIESEMGEEYILYKEGKKKLPKFANPIISIMVLANARIILYENLKKINFEDLIYCDTDSIAMTNFEKYKDKFKIGTGLGEWKIEFNKAKGEFIKEKIYKIEEGENKKIVFAGSTARNLTDKQIEGEDEIINKKMFSYNMGFSTGKLDKIGTFFEVKTKVNPNYRKRLVQFPKVYREYDKEDLIEN